VCVGAWLQKVTSGYFPQFSDASAVGRNLKTSVVMKWRRQGLRDAPSVHPQQRGLRFRVSSSSSYMALFAKNGVQHLAEEINTVLDIHANVRCYRRRPIPSADARCDGSEFEPGENLDCILSIPAENFSAESWQIIRRLLQL